MTTTIAPETAEQHAPNETFFKAQGEFSLTDGRKAFVDDSGTYRTALGEEASSTHGNVSAAWLLSCIPAADIFAHVDKLAETKHDIKTAESNVRLDSELRLPGGTPMTLYGMRTLMTFAGIPTKMQDWLIVNDYQADLARFANESLDRREIEWAEGGKTPREPRDFMLRFVKEDGKNVVRAVLSSQYARFDNHQACHVVGAALKDLTDVLVSHAWTNQDAVSIDLLLPDEMQDLPDGRWGVGFSFQNNEIGSGSFKLEPYLFRTVTKTGLRWGLYSSVIKVQQRHSGELDENAILADVERAIAVALTEGRSMMSVVGAAQRVKLKNTAAVISALGRETGMTKTDVLAVAKSYARAARDPFLKDTAFGVVHAISDAAREESGERRTMLENAAGTMVNGSLDETKVDAHWASIESAATRRQDKELLAQVEEILGGQE